MSNHSAVLTAVVLAAVPCTAAHRLSAQAAPPQPEVHYVTVSTFQAPYGDERTKVLAWIDSVVVPSVKMNPHVLSFRIGGHAWGSNGQDIVFIAEYATWADIGARCDECNRWFEQKQPKDGTPERAKWNDMSNTFLKYYASHSDQIYSVNMTRSK